MKRRLLIPPLVALLIGVCGVVAQRLGMSEMKGRSELLYKRITAAHATSPQDRIATAAKQLDWKKIASQFVDFTNNGGIGDERAMLQLELQVRSMSTEELHAALDDIAATEMMHYAKNWLNSLLLQPLIEKDPRLALLQNFERTENPSILATAFKGWAEKSPQEAADWLDQMIESGRFDSKRLDGKNPPRLHYEAALISELLRRDAAAAERRLDRLPVDQRELAMSAFLHQPIKPENQPSFGRILREKLPSASRSELLRKAAATTAGESGLSEVSALMNGIQATTDERIEMAEAAAERELGRMESIGRHEIDHLREWIASHAPGILNRETGKALAAATHKTEGLSFEDAAALAADYHMTGANDDVIIYFLQARGKAQDSEITQARALAERITDEERRASLLERLK